MNILRRFFSMLGSAKIKRCRSRVVRNSRRNEIKRKKWPSQMSIILQTWDHDEHEARLRPLQLARVKLKLKQGKQTIFIYRKDFYLVILFVVDYIPIFCLLKKEGKVFPIKNSTTQNFLCLIFFKLLYLDLTNKFVVSKVYSLRYWDQKG